jgi:hypothetical protein
MSSKYHQTCGIIWLKEMIYTSERLDWIGLAFFRFSWETHAWNLPQTNYKSAKKAVHLVHIGLPSVCWKTYEQNITNILSIKNSIILMMSVSENFLLESVCFWFAKNYPCLVWPYLLAFQTYKNNYYSINWLKFYFNCYLKYFQFTRYFTK